MAQSHTFSVVLIAILALGVILSALVIATSRRRQTPLPSAGRRRILFPFVGEALSADALDCALRLASAEHATLVPALLSRVPFTLPLEAVLPQQGTISLGLQDAIEQRASTFGVPVDARIERGRTHRHALRQAIATERYDRIVVAAAYANGPGIAADDVRWLLDNAPGEIVVLRPNTDTHITPPRAPRQPEPSRSLKLVS
jgi:nucleotide-binding universal stress UspA family protein